MAAKPLALTRQEGPTILVLKDSGGKPSVRFFCHATASARSGPLVLPSEVSGLDDFRGFLKYDAYVETLEEWGRVVEGSEYIPVEHLGTTDDSRFLPLAMILPRTMTLPLTNPGAQNLLRKGIGGDL